jgi:hypothetical protein
MGKPASGSRGSALMQAAWERYDAGDVVQARRLAHDVLKKPETPADTEQAQDLLSRTRLPRQVFVIAIGAFLLLILLWFLAVHRGALAR